VSNFLTIITQTLASSKLKIKFKYWYLLYCGYCVKRHFQQYFSYIVAVLFY